MFARLYPAKPQSHARFDTCSKFNELREILDQLYSHTASMCQKGNEAGANSLAYLKYCILNQTTKKLKDLIDAYNNQDYSEREDSDDLALVRQLELISNNVIETYGNTLNLQRNAYLEIRNALVTAGAYSTIFAATSILPFANIVSLLTAVYAGPRVSEAAHRATGTTNKNATSYQLIARLNKCLRDIGINIDPAMDWNQINASNSPDATNHDPKGYFSIMLLDPADISKDDFDILVKSHYRALTLIHHPDKPGGNTEKFKLLNEANEILSDKHKRDNYIAQCKQATSTLAAQAARYQ